MNLYNRASSPLSTRTRDEVAALFDGFELVPPGVVYVPLWRPDADVPDPERAGVYGGVGRKP